jgi:hypothetical protein
VYTLHYRAIQTHNGSVGYVGRVGQRHVASRVSARGRGSERNELCVRESTV